ncbi:hypothetical protein HMPREF1407_01287 [Helicobacter pylori GAM244Ai]|nr:hypothetical protein HMPREF1407_01287 [Helicobacter pylori GAM244Ai]
MDPFFVKKGVICHFIVFFFFFQNQNVSLFYGIILNFNKKAFGKKGA